MVFTIGETLASAVVKEAVNMVRVALESGVGLLWSFKEELGAMGDTLEVVHAALKDADAAPASAMDETARLLLRRLRAAARDIEDLLEEFAARDADTPGCRNCCCKVSYCCYNISVSRSIMAHKMKKMRERLQRIRDDAGIARSHGGMGGNSRDQDDISRRETLSDLGEYIVGREEEKESVVSALLCHDKEKISVVAIHGFGGLGKTTLARLAFNAKPVEAAFNHRFWIHVSMNYDLKKIGKSIVSKLKGSGSDDLDDLKAQLKWLLKDKIFLIVLDDVWEENESKLEDLLSFLDVGAKGSMVLITTRYEKIAKNMNPVLCCRLECLSDEECWDIFKRKAFLSEAKEVKLQHIGRDIVKKCKGVPLAVESLGFIMRWKEDVDDWEDIRDSRIWEVKEERDMRVLAPLKLSFHHLPTTLKLCFVYCSVFPKGSDIYKDLLIQQWIALGFIQPNEPPSSSIRRGEDYVQQLLGMSFLQISTIQTPVTKKSIKDTSVFHLHDLVYDLARSLALDEFLFLDGENNSKVSSTQSDYRYAVLTSCNTTTFRKDMMRKLRALHVIEWKEKEFPNKVLASKFLRVLNLSGSSVLELPSCIKQLKLLRYLDASGMQGKTLKYVSSLQHLQALKLSGSLLVALPHQIGLLEKLRYLNLHGCLNLLVLPESICNLTNLQHLDLSNSSALKELPPDFGKLTNLSTLNLYGCPMLKMLPESICNLTNLQHLDMSNSSALRELPPDFGKLTNLSTLNLCGCPMLKMLPESFSGLNHLVHLNLSSCCELTNLPRNFGDLEKLCVLNLSNCKQLDTLPESFAKLQYLEFLSLSCCYKLKELPELFGDLQALQRLEMSDCRKLQILPESITRLKFLEVLILSDCWELTGLPESFGNLEKLQSLDLSSSQISALPESVCDLVNLKYMNISWCTDLQKLPGNYGKLQKLEELNMSYIGNGHINIPNGIGNMSNLKILLADDFSSRSWESEEDIVLFDALRGYRSKFIFSGEVKPSDLSFKDHTLQVGGLGRVQNLMEVEELQLQKRRQLRSLRVNWVYGTGSESAEELVPQEDVLEKLQPPRTLEHFELWCCTISTFPSWMTNIASFLPRLAHLELRYLETCDCLPPLGQLPELRILVISYMPHIKEVDQRFSGGTRPFRKLRNLVIENMQNLEKWHADANVTGDDVEFMFPVLHHVKVHRCPKLRFEPFLPQCVSWEIERSNEVLSSGVRSNDPSYYMPTIRVLIKSCTLSSYGLMGLKSFTSLKFLTTYGCRSTNNWTESMGVLTSLKYFNIQTSHVPVRLGDFSSLEYLQIQNSTMDYSTLEQVQRLTALVDLSICCTSPTNFLQEQEVNWLSHMASCLENLVNLELDNFIGCDRLPPLGHLQKLRSLTLKKMPNLKTVGEDISGGSKSFPMLQVLKLGNMPNLERWHTAQATGVRIFPNLQLLKVYNCPKLKFVPFLPVCSKCIINSSSEVLMPDDQNMPVWDMPTSELSCLFLHGKCTGLQYFKDLRSLSVLGCNMSSWRESVIPITSLQKLQLCQNEIPGWLHELSSLRELHIKKCKTPLNLSQFVDAHHQIVLEALRIEDCWEMLVELPAQEIWKIVGQISTVEIIHCQPVMRAEWRNGEFFGCKLRKSSEWYIKPEDAGSLPIILGTWQEGSVEVGSDDITNPDQPGPSGTK